MMLEILTFAQCLQKLMLEYQLNSTSVASLIGGRVALRKLLQDEASAAKRKEAFEKLVSADLFSSADCKRLSEALEVSRIGVEAYQFQRSIRYVLTGEISDDFFIQPLKTDKGALLSDRLEPLQKAETINILCVNCSSHSLFSVLIPLFADKERKIRLQHYIHADAYANTAANFIAVVYPLFFDRRYEAFGINRTGAAPHYLGGNLLAIQAKCSGERMEYFFVISNDHCAYEMPKAASGDMFAFIRTLVESVSPAPYSLKQNIGHPNDFHSLYMGHFSHELNRVTYTISSDLLIQQVPTEIAVSALREKQMLPPQEMEELIRTTAPIHEQRYQNQYCKKKPDYRVMTILGCKRFLDTGLNTDHFYGFRAFTPEERKRIFGEMLKQARENPYFIVHLVKEKAYNNRYTIVCYDKLGVSVDYSTTDYSWEVDDHSLFLTYPEFTRQYLDFYLKIIVKEKCYPEEESIQILERMYQDFLQEYSLVE